MSNSTHDTTENMVTPTTAASVESTPLAVSSTRHNSTPLVTTSSDGYLATLPAATAISNPSRGIYGATQTTAHVAIGAASEEDNTTPVPQGLIGGIPLSITTTSFLTTETNGHLTTIPVTTKVVPNPSALPSSPSNPARSSDKGAVIGGAVGAIVLLLALVLLVIFIERHRKEKVDLLESGTDDQGDAPEIRGVSVEPTMEVIPFLVPARRPVLHPVMTHDQGKQHRTPQPSFPWRPVHLQDVAEPQETEELESRVAAIVGFRRVDALPLEGGGEKDLVSPDRVPNPFADSADRQASGTSPGNVNGGPEFLSQQDINLLAVRVAEILRGQDGALGEAQPMGPTNNGTHREFQRESHTSHSISMRSSSTAPPTYATHEE